MGTAPVPLKMNGITEVLTSEVVKLVVGQGDGQKTFYIHKELFQSKAPVFDKMFGGSFKEALTGSAALPDDTCEAFEIFSKWLYLSMTEHTNLIILDLVPRPLTCKIRWQLIETIVFADKYCIDELSDLIMSVWMRFQKDGLPIMELKKITSYIVANCANRCKARDFFALTWASVMLQNPGEGHYIPIGTDLDAFINDNDFAKQVIKGMSSLACRTNDGWQRLCDYHLHGRSVFCYELRTRVHINPPESVGGKTSVPNPAKKRQLA
ncbi:hypothetical protein V502_05496 [Pseudogymnoascus sp. VKM F-4520 (FW-2644)]|nr:hypothetical protein V502_05496 [Pseudogymnoascus sp. VKM F-4520 (FW-2644)]